MEKFINNYTTAFMRQYLALKRELPQGSVLLVRLGDFYEAFGEDAKIASPILGETLTMRGSVPMCGVPYYAIDTYLAKLIRAGKTVALAEEAEDPRAARDGIIRREITRLITPGTIEMEGANE